MGVRLRVHVSRAVGVERMLRRSIRGVGVGIRLRGLRLMVGMHRRRWIMGVIVERGVMCQMRFGASSTSLLEQERRFEPNGIKYANLEMGRADSEG
jgi:hypothetical protein